MDSSIIMQTYLLVSQNQNFIKKQIALFKEKIHLSPFNLHVFSPNPSIGIEEVRKLRSILTKKPFGGGDRLIIINDIEKATIEAANALLKVLEEPPRQTFLILTTSNLAKILSTVISRCQVIVDNTPSKNELDKEMTETLALLKQILNSKPGERILLSQKICKSKEETAKMLDLMIKLLRYLLYQEENKLKLSRGQIANLISKTVAAKNYLEKNVNYKATLDILFLGFPKL